MQRSRINLLVILIVIAVVGCDDDPVRSVVGGSTSGSITAVSGNGQTGRVGALLDEPFVVRVTNAAGQGLGSVPVEWSVTRGVGSLCHSDPPQCSTDAVTTTGPDGRTAVRFNPALGTGPVQVIARLGQSVLALVVFTARVDGVIVHIGPLLECSAGDPVRFAGPDGSPETWIGGGEVVEWRNRPFSCDSAHIVSTVVPPRGTPVDSGIIPPGGRYVFVPDAPGQWEFLDQRSGARGTLVVS